MKLGMVQATILDETPLAPTSAKKDSARFDSILDAAEHIFANDGFNGASMRGIAQRAGVAQALIHYHFNNKEKLFEATTARQAEGINSKRVELLNAILTSKNTATLEDIVEALFRPTIETGNDLAKSGGNFSRSLVFIANSTDPRNRQLISQWYDPIALIFIAAFEKVIPELKHKDAVWSYLFSISVGVMMMSQTGRSMDLSNGVCDDSDVEALLEEITTFVCGGIRAFVTKNKE